MKLKKILALALAISLMSLLFVGCTDDSTDKSNAPATNGGEKIYIPMVSKGFQHQFWQAVKQGAEKAATELGIEINFVGPKAETEVQEQINQLTTELGKNPQAVCFAALDTKAAEDLLKQCKEKNIPVVGFDSGVDSDIPVSTVATNSKAAGAIAADKMAEAIGSEGTIGVICHSETSQTGIDRRDGFLEQIAAKYPNITVLPVQVGNGDHALSANIAKAMVTANPEIKGIFGTNEGSAVGAYNGLKEVDKLGSVKLIGFDSSKTLKDAIRAGEIYGAVSQDPVQMGYLAVVTAYKAYKGETVEKNIDTGCKWYDKDNVDSPDLAPLLYD